MIRILRSRRASHARPLLARLRADAGGVALIEFALSLPLLLSVGLVGIEVAHFGIANLRINQIAMLTADQAGRVRDSISEADVAELFTGAKLMGAGIGFADNGRIILSSVEPKTSGGAGQWIRWQRCFGKDGVTSSYGYPRTGSNTVIADGTESFTSAGAASGSPSDQQKSIPTNGSINTPAAIGPTGNQIAATNGTAVMFVEVVYEYQPMVSGMMTSWLTGGKTIRSLGAFNVRQRTNQSLQPAGYTTAQRYTCNKYTTS